MLKKNWSKINENQLYKKIYKEVIWNIEKEEIEKFVKQEYVEILLDKKSTDKI